MAGKIKRMMLDLVEEKIDENKIQSRIGDFNVAKGFGLIPRGTPDMLLVGNVPKSIYDRFQQWCTVRGVSISWKIKQLMFAYIKGYIE